MDISGHLQVYMDIYRYIWISLDICGYLWISLDIFGHLPDISGHLWISLDIYENKITLDLELIVLKKDVEEKWFVTSRFKPVKDEILEQEHGREQTRRDQRVLYGQIKKESTFLFCMTSLRDLEDPQFGALNQAVPGLLNR